MGSVSESLARINRNQWAEYKRNFYRFEEMLVDNYANDEKAANLVKENRAAGMTGFNAAIQIRDQQRSDYGIVTNERDRAIRARADQINRMLSDVNTTQVTRQAIADRDESLMTGAFGQSNNNINTSTEGL